MMQDALSKHLKTGSTTVCRTWMVRRKDGTVRGFTDHDCDLSFDDVVFLARTGMTAGALEKTTGMAVDNTEVMGALSDDSVSEDDIVAGRYDGAEVTTYLVNWADVSERSILFRGTFGEIVRSNGSFRVELRGLTEALNVQSGRVYHSKCSAALGDRFCKVDMSSVNHFIQTSLKNIIEGRLFHFAVQTDYSDGWFVDGTAEVMSGVGKGQSHRIKSDSTIGGVRVVELWQTLELQPVVGDIIKLVVGCDRRASTCRNRFNNFLNFRGFPHIPGEDWLRSNPSNSSRR